MPGDLFEGSVVMTDLVSSSENGAVDGNQPGSGVKDSNSQRGCSSTLWTGGSQRCLKWRSTSLMGMGHEVEETGCPLLFFYNLWRVCVARVSGYGVCYAYALVAMFGEVLFVLFAVYARCCQ